MPKFAGLVAAILVGGLGTRLRESVADRPKAMAVINGQPFLYYLLEHLYRSGIQKVVLCTGYMGDYIEMGLGSSFRGMTLIYSREDRPLGTAGALKLAEPFFDGDEILVMNGDSFTEFNAQELLAWHRGRPAKISILLTKVNNADRFGYVELDRQNRIVSFVEKGTGSIEGVISSGVYILARDVIANMPDNIPCSLEDDIFSVHGASGLYGYLGGNSFIDIGTPDSYSVAGIFLDKIESRRLSNYQFRKEQSE